MRNALPLLGVVLLATLGTFAAQQDPSPEKQQEPPSTTEPAKPSSAEARKNPVKPTPEGLAEAKKVFGYDCAMCHGEHGDGKGDLVGSMGLKMKDWNDPSALAGITDGEMFDIIAKGKGKMVGEGDRVPPEKIWQLVDYVKTFSKKGAQKPATADGKS